MKSPMVAAAFCLLLAGCAIPPAVSIATSTAADGVLLASTGKTGMDHGLSFASGRDCAVWRAFDGIEICKDAPEVIQAAAAAEVPALVAEQPAEVVGEEHHHVVLDGRS